MNRCGDTVKAANRFERKKELKKQAIKKLHILRYYKTCFKYEIKVCGTPTLFLSNSLMANQRHGLEARLEECLP